MERCCDRLKIVPKSQHQMLMIAPLFRSIPAAALRPFCAANIRGVRSSSDEEDRTSLMIAAQLGREEVAELLLKKGQILTVEKKTNNFGCQGRGKKTNSFCFAKFGNFEDAFHSLAICNKSNVLLALLSALSCCVIQTKEFF